MRAYSDFFFRDSPFPSHSTTPSLYTICSTCSFSKWGHCVCACVCVTVEWFRCQLVVTAKQRQWHFLYMAWRRQLYLHLPNITCIYYCTHMWTCTLYAYAYIILFQLEWISFDSIYLWLLLKLQLSISLYILFPPPSAAGKRCVYFIWVCLLASIVDETAHFHVTMWFLALDRICACHFCFVSNDAITSV